MKIIILGKNGQVGFELCRALAPLGEVISFSSQQCDLANHEQIKAVINQHQPVIIVNAAAYTAVDKAESEQKKACAINATAVNILAELALQHSALLVHYSTDYVFSGAKSIDYVEEDQTSPLSVYAASKLAGEQAIKNNLTQYLILRTSWVYGVHGNNFPKTMLRLAKERENLSVVADQFGAPTSAALIADVTAHLIKEYQAFKLVNNITKFPFGLYHLTASGVTNWHQYASFVIENAIKLGFVTKLNLADIKAITTNEYPTAAKRPTNSKLNCDKLQKTFALQLPAWQDGVIHFLQQIV